MPGPACVTFLKLAHFYPFNLIGALSMKLSNDTVIDCVMRVCQIDNVDVIEF